MDIFKKVSPGIMLEFLSCTKLKDGVYTIVVIVIYVRFCILLILIQNLTIVNNVLK